MQALGGSLAQLVEQQTFNLLVVGSIPTRPTNKIKYLLSIQPSKMPKASGGVQVFLGVIT